MSLKGGARFFVPFVLLSLASCSSALVPVRDITVDRIAYLQKNFTVDRVPKSVASRVTALDKGPLPFGKIVMNVTETVNAVQNGVPKSAYQSIWTIVNTGSAIVEAIDEQQSNGIPTRQIYKTAYRNIFTLRTQTVPLNGTNANPIMQVQSINLFTPIGSNDKPGYSYEWAAAEDTRPGVHYQYYCQYAATYPAATVNAKFVGTAQDLSCSLYNANGAPERQTLLAYLIHYGVGIPKQINTAGTTTTYTIDSVEVR